MLAIVDTGFLFALANSRDIHHQRALDIARTSSDTFIVTAHGSSAAIARS